MGGEMSKENCPALNNFWNKLRGLEIYGGVIFNSYSESKFFSFVFQCAGKHFFDFRSNKISPSSLLKSKGERRPPGF